jgi:hypothetical protein
VGDGAAVGVGVDQQGLAGQLGRLEGEVERDRRASGRPLGAPDRHERMLAARRPVGCGRGGRVVVARLGPARGAGELDEFAGAVGVPGDVDDAELAQSAFGVLVAGGDDPDDGDAGRAQPGDGLAVQPAGGRRDDGDLGLPGGGDREEVAEVVAALDDLGGGAALLAGLGERRLPGRAGAGGDHAQSHVGVTAPSRPGGCWRVGAGRPSAARVRAWPAP